MKRREFLAAAAAATAMPVWGKRIDRTRVSAITDEIARSPAAAIEFAKQYKLQWLELRAVPGVRGEYFQLPVEKLKEAAKEFKDNGVRISFLNTSMLKFGMPGVQHVSPWVRESPRFEKRVEELRKSIEAAEILGTNKVRIFTFMRAVDHEAQYPRVAEIINELAEIAAKSKTMLLIENEGACNVATAAELKKLIDMIPSKWVGINWDPHNAENKQEVAFPDGYELLPSKRIHNVQIKGKSILVGEGDKIMDWAAIFRRLEKDGYQGQVGLETHIFGEIQVQKSHESIREILRIVGES